MAIAKWMAEDDRLVLEDDARGGDARGGASADDDDSGPASCAPGGAGEPEDARAWLTCACAFLAGSGTWLTVTCLFAEGSLLVSHFRERTLYSTMDLAVQFGNAGPFLCVTLLASFTARRGAAVSMGLLLAGSACMLWTALLWREAGVAGVIASSFVGGLVGSTSMVTIYSAAGQSRPDVTRRRTTSWGLDGSAESVSGAEHPRQGGDEHARGRVTRWPRRSRGGPL